MALLDYFLMKKEKPVTTASKAKERLQIIVAHERNSRNKPDYLPQLTEDILNVLRKYVQVSDKSLSINLDNKGGDLNVLELNIELQDENNPD